VDRNYVREAHGKLYAPVVRGFKVDGDEDGRVSGGANSLALLGWLII